MLSEQLEFVKSGPFVDLVIEAALYTDLILVFILVLDNAKVLPEPLAQQSSRAYHACSCTTLRNVTSGALDALDLRLALRCTRSPIIAHIQAL